MINHPIVLTIAGSDPSAGAGIQADLKTLAANGCYGASVITTVTSQNTKGVNDIFSLPIEVIKSQFNAVMEDLDVQVIKTGMLGSKEACLIVDELLEKYMLPVVIDPVMSATDGTSLLEGTGLKALKSLLKKAFLITPNIPEAEILTGLKITNVDEMKEACLQMDAESILLKGGHLEGNILVDVLYNDKQFYEFKHRKILTKNTHGTGCTLASAIASQLAKGLEIPEACEAAIAYVKKAILENYPTGQGNGSLNHFYMLKEKKSD